MSTLLVTGGCGFIGSHFVRLVLQRTSWRVVNIDSLTYAGDPSRLSDVEELDRYRFVHGDIVDEDLLDRIFAEEHPSAVVNFAAESHVDRSILDASPFLTTNVLGVHRLLETVRRHSAVRFVQISTDEVYGDIDASRFSTEESPLLPSSPYAATKAAADLLCLAYHRTHKLPILIVRSANNYGTFQFPEKLIPLIISNLMKGETLPVYGDGGQVRDWLYVADNCEAVLAVLEQGQPGAIYNVSTGEQRRNIDVVGAVCASVAEQAGMDARRLFGQIRQVEDRPGHDRRYAIDAAKIRSELAWAPRVRFEDGLRMTVRWYLDHMDWVRRVTSGEYSRYYEAVYRRRWQRT